LELFWSLRRISVATTPSILYDLPRAAEDLFMSLTLRADVAADTRYALRGFKRTPGLTLITVLTLAVGLGATAAIFSVVNAVLLKPLPYTEPERLVQIVEHVPASEGFGGTAQRRTAMNTAELDWWRTNSTTLSEIAVMAGGDGRTLATADGSVQLYGQRVSPALFPMRGVPPLLGRGLLQEDERPDNDVVVLGEAAWRDYFNAAPDIVGSRIRLNNQTLTVVGVMPPAFGEEAFWAPFVPPRPGTPGFQFVGARQIRWRERNDRAHADERESQSDGAADRRQQQALREELADEPRPSGAEHGSNGELPPPRDAPRKQQVRDVRARQ
jgi:hypothetical protein